MFGKMPIAISTFGPEVDKVIFLIYAITGVFFFVMEGYLIYLVVRYRRGSKAEYQTGESWKELKWIFGLAAIVVVLDFAIDFRGGRTWALIKEEMPEQGLEIRVEAKQFDWTFIYPGERKGRKLYGPLAMPRVLHIPVNQKILLTLTSQDVIHSFFLPEVRLKQDIMPGREIRAWFEATQTGTYTLVCSELCGFGHTRMSGVLQVDSPELFQKWLKDARKEQGGNQ